MTAIVHLMLPQFVPDFTIHVDSLEIYDVTSLCVSSYQAHSRGGGGGGSPHPLLVWNLLKCIRPEGVSLFVFDPLNARGT